MKTFTLLMAAVFLAVAPAMGHVINVCTSSDPTQDDWFLSGEVHEVGLSPPFPSNEKITATGVPWGGHVPCTSEYQHTGCAQVRMTNQTGKSWPRVYYVADVETTITNYDEWVGQTGPTSTPWFAFLIDAGGANTPLVYESLNPDGRWDPGETWEFVIQDYINSSFGPASAFNSLNITSASPGYPPSTGSILVVPEPATLSLLAIGGLGIIRRRKK